MRMQKGPGPPGRSPGPLLEEDTCLVRIAIQPGRARKMARECASLHPPPGHIKRLRPCSTTLRKKPSSVSLALLGSAEAQTFGTSLAFYEKTPQASPNRLRGREDLSEEKSGVLSSYQRRGMLSRNFRAPLTTNHLRQNQVRAAAQKLDILLCPRPGAERRHFLQTLPVGAHGLPCQLTINVWARGRSRTPR